MNTTNMLLNIYKMLGLQFKEEKFAMLKLKDGNTNITNNMDGAFELGQEIFIVGENSELKPAPAGKHTLANGTVIQLSEGSVLESMMDVKDQEMGYEDPLVEQVRVEDADEEVDTLEEELTKAEATDGKILESDTFDVGERVYMVDGDETKPAPDGEYELSLKDTSGNENKMKIFVKDGVITERENVETMAKTPSEMEMMKEEMATIKMAIQEMLGYLKNKDEQMSAELSKVKTDFESFRKSPAASPIEKKINVSQTFDDWRVEQIKKLRK
jgi:hypothetical protein